MAHTKQGVGLTQLPVHASERQWQSMERAPNHRCGEAESTDYRCGPGGGLAEMANYRFRKEFVPDTLVNETLVPTTTSMDMQASQA